MDDTWSHISIIKYKNSKRCSPSARWRLEGSDQNLNILESCCARQDRRTHPYQSIIKGIDWLIDWLIYGKLNEGSHRHRNSRLLINRISTVTRLACIISFRFPPDKSNAGKCWKAVHSGDGRGGLHRNAHRIATSQGRLQGFHHR